ncbi:MAG: 5-formyltetrahydrofolate cyclo-ligase [Verrucomicrobiota bacterium]
MNETIAQAKSQLRAEVRRRLKELPAAAQASASDKICERLRHSEPWRAARSVFCFAPLAGEPDVWPLLAEALSKGKQIALPRFDAATGSYVACLVRDLGTDLQSGRFGIREPNIYCPVLPVNRLDLTLVPGVAFDLRGRRLGRGKGYYDRLLTDARGMTCGVAFDEQIVADIPREPHDIPLTCILTPTRWIEP